MRAATREERPLHFLRLPIERVRQSHSKVKVEFRSGTGADSCSVAYWEHILNGLVYELYFPEEVHGAGLGLFDLVAAAELPDLKTIPEAQRLRRLREQYETLQAPDHPLRQALDKLQTLDTVRIIEGKATG